MKKRKKRKLSFPRVPVPPPGGPHGPKKGAHGYDRKRDKKGAEREALKGEAGTASPF